MVWSLCLLMVFSLYVSGSGEVLCFGDAGHISIEPVHLEPCCETEHSSPLAAIENERVRLQWEGVPLWFSPGFFDAFEEKYGAVFLPNTYGSQVPGLRGLQRDLSDPLRALAGGQNLWMYYENHLPPGRGEMLVHLVEKCHIDGFVFLMAEI